jgi:general secretion pathway protein E
MSEKDPPVQFEEVMDLDGLSSEQATARLVKLALSLPASDLFILANEGDTAIAARHLGVVKRLGVCTGDTGRRLISHFKAFAAMDVVQNRRPQDGRSVFAVTKGERIDLRINTIPTLYGEDMTVRLLRRGMERLELPAVGLHRKDLHDLYNLLSKPSGLLLVTGPTGSGKTTTLYGCLQHLNNGLRKINTIEDPIEYELGGVRQTQVNPRIELDFPELLRSVLRQAPDVIMIGEIRDPTTAETAVLAANSGHLVLATLHAPVAAAAVDSLLAYDIHPHFLSTCLLGIVSQRLVRTLCPHCKKAYDLSGAPLTFEEVSQWLEPGEGEAIYSAPGCDKCFREGYVERTGVFEVLRASNDIRRFVLERRGAPEIHAKAIEEGMLDLRRSALLKVAKGTTSMEEVIRMISTEHLMPT